MELAWDRFKWRGLCVRSVQATNSANGELISDEREARDFDLILTRIESVDLFPK
jgi:hypothetical protein